jgi:hypothetical protein
MKTNGFPEIKEVMSVPHYRPAVSVILPIKPKIGLDAEAHKDIKFATDRVERLLKDQYSEEITETIIQKINKLIGETTFPAGKKGLALYASPLFANIYFLDTDVPERIIVDESFEIRDLLFNRKEEKHFLLFVLSSERCKLFMHTGQQLMPVKLESPNSVDAYWNDETERVSNFTDPVVFKTNQVEKFIRQMDKELVQTLRTHDLPVFLMGSKTILGLYKRVTHLTSHIQGIVEGNFEESTISELMESLQPVYDQWKRQQQQGLLRQIEDAANQKKLSVGIQDVWKTAYDKKGRLLVVERNYVAAGEHVSAGKIVYKPTVAQNDFHSSNDVVDDVIEMVLQNGGDVAFTEDGFLSGFDHIALIQYYS